MLTATYDGHTVRLYRNGVLAGEENLTLSNDEPVVQIAPLDPWSHSRRFTGEIREFGIWKTALPAETLHLLMDRLPK